MKRTKRLRRRSKRRRQRWIAKRTDPRRLVSSYFDALCFLAPGTDPRIEQFERYREMQRAWGWGSKPVAP